MKHVPKRDLAQEQVLKALGQRIKSIRLQKKIRQNVIAMRCDFSKGSYSNIEAGKRNVTVLTLDKIAKALDVKVERFFTGI